MSAQQQRLDSLDARSVWRVLKRRKRIVFVCAGVFVALAIGVDFLMPPVYRATVRLEIRRPLERTPLTGQALANPSYQSENLNMLTAADQITSRRLLGQVASDFDSRGWIQTIPTVAWKPPMGQGLARWLPVAAARAAGEPGATQKVDPAMRDAQVDWLETIVNVEPVQDTRLVDVKVEHGDPDAARAIADRLGQLFVSDQWLRSVDADTSGLLYLDEELAQMRSRIQASGESADGAGIAQMAAAEAKIRQANETITELSAEHLKAHDDLVAAQARIASMARGDDSDPIPGGSPGLEAVRRDLQACRQQLVSARQVFKEKHPKLIALEAQYAALQDAYRQERGQVVAGLKTDAAILAARERGLQASLDQSEQALSAAQQMSQRYGPVSTDLKTSQDLYGLLAAKVQEGRIEGLMKTPPVEIVDAATLDPAPVQPRKVLNLVVGLLAGLFVGSGLALFRESMHRTVRVPQDVEDQLDLPVVGVIPKQG